MEKGTLVRDKGKKGEFTHRRTVKVLIVFLAEKKGGTVFLDEVGGGSPILLQEAARGDHVHPLPGGQERVATQPRSEKRGKERRGTCTIAQHGRVEKGRPCANRGTSPNSSVVLYAPRAGKKTGVRPMPKRKKGGRFLPGRTIRQKSKDRSIVCAGDRICPTSIQKGGLTWPWA